MNKIKSINSSFSKNFFLFLLASVFFWFINKLSKEYENTIEYPVVYQNFPKDKLLQLEPLKTVHIHVKSTGFKIASSQLFPGKLEIDASDVIKRGNHQYYILLSQQKIALEKQLASGVEIHHFLTDTIPLSLGALEKKKVPVKLNSNFSFTTGYEIDGTVLITPDSVEVLGPENVLDTILEVQTIMMNRVNINEDINEELNLIETWKNKNTKLKIDRVSISAKVEKFTQGELEIPFEILNLPEENKISTFPKTVKVTYSVALDNYNKVTTDGFRIVCDYNTAINNELSYLIPIVKASPSFVKNVKIAPNRIEYILEK